MLVALVVKMANILVHFAHRRKAGRERKFMSLIQATQAVLHKLNDDVLSGRGYTPAQL